MIGLLTAALLTQEAPGYSQGPFNLVLRWGSGAPVVIRYETRARCETAAVMVITQPDTTVQGKGRPDIPASPQVKGANAPWAFCIPG
jgi:hypothetical protein